MFDLLEKLESILKKDIYCIFENDEEYIVTTYEPDQVYVIDKELEDVRPLLAFEEEAGQLLTKSKMIYSADKTDDADLFDNY